METRTWPHQGGKQNAAYWRGVRHAEDGIRFYPNGQNQDTRIAYSCGYHDGTPDTTIARDAKEKYARAAVAIFDEFERNAGGKVMPACIYAERCGDDPLDYPDVLVTLGGYADMKFRLERDHNCVTTSYFSDITGRVWRGRLSPEGNLHYARLEGIQGDGSPCWVLRQSEKEQAWKEIPSEEISHIIEREMSS